MSNPHPTSVVHDALIQAAVEGIRAHLTTFNGIAMFGPDAVVTVEKQEITVRYTVGGEEIVTIFRAPWSM